MYILLECSPAKFRCNFRIFLKINLSCYGAGRKGRGRIIIIQSNPPPPFHPFFRKFDENKHVIFLPFFVSGLRQRSGPTDTPRSGGESIYSIRILNFLDR